MTCFFNQEKINENNDFLKEVSEAVKILNEAINLKIKN